MSEEICGADTVNRRSDEMSMDRILEAILETTGEDPAPAGNGYKACCPAHDDENPSLSVYEDKNGRARVKCFAGCKPDEILAALGLDALAYNLPPDADTIYPYKDGDGELAFEKVRMPGKKFLLRRSTPDSDGFVWGLSEGCYLKKGRDWKLDKKAKRDRTVEPSPDARWFEAAKPVLYRLPEVLNAVGEGKTVYFVEGEKDADNVANLGLESTTTFDGAGGKWLESYADPLKGGKIVVVPDADEPGQRYAEKVCDGLKGIAAEVRLLKFADLPDGGKDVSDWLAAGHTREELEKLAAEAPLWKGTAKDAVILDAIPDRIRRPLSLIGGKAYAASWVAIGSAADSRMSLVVVRDDGKLFVERPDGLAGAAPLSELGLSVDLKTAVEESRRWSGKGINGYVKGERPDPAVLFEKLKVCAGHFLDFGRSIGSPEELAELVACFVFGTYLLDAFPVTGYLWATGESGSGKSTLLHVVCELAYLGQFILASGTFPALRDMADYGGTLGFDDAENVTDDRKIDPDKKALFLAGNHKGATVTLKEPQANGTWVLRYVNAFCPRLFSAVALPDSVLSSRTILVPMVRSADEAKSKRDPADLACWPYVTREIRDDLYAVALGNLPVLPKFDAKAAASCSIVGRDFQPWRAILGVALWLEEACGVTGLFARMNGLATNYQSERRDIETASPARFLVTALVRLFGDRGKAVEFAPTEVANEMNVLAEEFDVEHDGDSFMSAKKVGHLLGRLRFVRASRNAKAKKWLLTPDQLAQLARAHGVALPVKGDGPEPSKNGPKEECRSAVCAVSADVPDTPSASLENGTAVKADGSSAVCAVLSGSSFVPTENVKEEAPLIETASQGLNWGDA